MAYSSQDFDNTDAEFDRLRTEAQSKRKETVNLKLGVLIETAKQEKRSLTVD